MIRGHWIVGRRRGYLGAIDPLNVHWSELRCMMGGGVRKAAFTDLQPLG